jgi:PIN domain nuclease of toxin-antitoxin system
MKVELAVTDTHALLWFAQGLHRKLGAVTRRIFDAASAGEAVIYVPALVLVEASESIRGGGVRFPYTFAEWTRSLFSQPNFFPVDLSTEIVLRAEEFYSIPERGDRLIAATAAHLGYPLITRDPEIAAAGVEVIW